MDVSPEVSIVAPLGASLAAALCAALGAHGWRPVVHLDPPAAAFPVQACLLVVEDDTGKVRVPVPPAPPTRLVIVVSARSLPTVIPAVHRGAMLVNQGAPFLLLLRLVEQMLLAPSSKPSDAALEALRRRTAETQALHRLTRAETETLRRILEGDSSEEIARRTHRSPHTVRSHIRSVLTKLGVTSQLAAVAVARRSGTDELLGALELATFGDVRGIVRVPR